MTEEESKEESQRHITPGHGIRVRRPSRELNGAESPSLSPSSLSSSTQQRYDPKEKGPRISSLFIIFIFIIVLIVAVVTWKAYGMFLSLSLSLSTFFI